jgi:indole-3-glycerol phosphate synthase
MNILEKIIERKKEELLVRKSMVSEADMMKSQYFRRHCLSLTKNLLQHNAIGIIAEFKRKSPSRGYINQHADAAAITKAYTDFGASGLSVLTDHEFFGGSTEDLVAARQNDIPILRKEFIIDPYQIMAAKAMGADVILLIAACLSPTEVRFLAAYAKELKMEVLLELHDESELEHICESVDMVGINNRNLKTFKVDINHSLKLAKKIPEGKIKIAESGIDNIETIRLFKDAGYKGFLMGEKFMKETDPGEAFKLFVENLQQA